MDKQKKIPLKMHFLQVAYAISWLETIHMYKCCLTLRKVLNKNNKVVVSSVLVLSQLPNSQTAGSKNLDSGTRT